MPDTPKNPADDEAIENEIAQWHDGFLTGWRAAMAEVRRKDATVVDAATLNMARVGETVTITHCEGMAPRKAPWDHSGEGF